MTVFQFIKVAVFLKVFINLIRLKIIFLLNSEGKKTVNELVEILLAKQCYVSRHVNYLAGKGILEQRKDGQQVYYSLKSKDIVNLLGLSGTKLEMSRAKAELQIVNK